MKVSFVIPNYNTVHWLPQAVESCFNQTYKDIDIVIVDDGSTDSTPDYLTWLLKQGHKNLQVLTMPHVGRCQARNAGNEVAKGDIICVLDSDDYNNTNRAKLTVDKINKGIEFVYGSAEVMDVFGTKGEPIIADVFSLNKALDEMQNRIVHSSVGYTKAIAKKYPYSLDEEISQLGIDDWDQQIRIAKGGHKMDFISSPIVAYRLTHGISSTRDNNKVLEAKKRILNGQLVPA